MVRRVVALVVVLVVVGLGAIIVHAATEEEETFSTVEQEGSVLDASEGQRQVREDRLKEMQEERLLAEQKAEEERKRQEAIEAEERRVAEAKAEEKRQAKQAEVAKKEESQEVGSKEVKPATTSKAPAPAQTGSNLGTFEATAYGPDCVGCSGITANGTDIRNGNIYSNGYRVIAADPRVIPMNSIVKITYSSGNTEMAIVADKGGAIKGKIIDIAFPSEAEANPFGRQQVQIELIN